MSEPTSEASRIERVAEGIHGWHVRDNRIGARSDAYAVNDGSGLVLIDPLPLSGAGMEALTKLGPITAICLTATCHQRSAWRYRERFGAKIYGPSGGRLAAKPDRFYRAGSRLPASLCAIRTPGPFGNHHALLWQSGSGALFAGDLLIHLRAGHLRFTHDGHHEDKTLLRRSAAAILRLKFRALCTAHGVPITSGAKRAVRDALARDARG